MWLLDQMKSKAGDLANWAGDLLGSGGRKIREMIEEVNACGPLLEQVGYRLGELHVELSLSPRVMLLLTRLFPATEEQYQALLANNPGRKTLGLIVKAIQQAEATDAKLQLKGRRLSGVEVEIAFSPSVRLKYTAESPAPPSPPSPDTFTQ